MSPSVESRSRRDDGFTLVEVVVALAIVMVVAASLLPQLVAGIQATSTARTISQAKGVVQGQLDRMRNLPYYVSPAAGDHKDVLDYYFRNAHQGSRRGACVYGRRQVRRPGELHRLCPTSGARCSYEPSTGAFYRSVTKIPPAPGTVGFTVVVSTQFLTGATPPQTVEPPTGPTGYNSQSLDAGEATPLTPRSASRLRCCTPRGTVHPVTSYTQLYDQPTSTLRTRAEVGATTLEIGSSTKSNGAVSAGGGPAQPGWLADLRQHGHR